jgi:hypothetical protein
MSNKFDIFYYQEWYVTIPVPPDGIEGEVDGDLTVVRALQHVAGLQAVQEPLHQGYAPATAPTYNTTTELSIKYHQCFRISTVKYELVSRFFTRILSADTGCFLKYKYKSKQTRCKLLKVKLRVAYPGCLPQISQILIKTAP